MRKPLSKRRMREVRQEVQERFFDDVIKAHASSTTKAAGATTLRNIVGHGFAEKVTEGFLTNEHSVVFYVKKKLPSKRLRDTRIPAEIGGLPTDVVEVGEAELAASSAAVPSCGGDPEARQTRPFAAGVSIGGGMNAAGSLGYRVKRKDEGDLILSNFHVLGDMSDPTQSHMVFQPGRGDGTLAPEDVIGEYRAGVPLVFGPAGSNEMDAAVATVKPGICLPSLCGAGVLTGAADPTDGEAVRIYGKHSHFSAGLVKGITSEYIIGTGAEMLRFVDQLVIERDPRSRLLVEPGDSGSIVVKAPLTACALIFARIGTDYALATPIERIFKRFRIELVT